MNFQEIVHVWNVLCDNDTDPYITVVLIRTSLGAIAINMIHMIVVWWIINLEENMVQNAFTYKPHLSPLLSPQTYAFNFISREEHSVNANGTAWTKNRIHCIVWTWFAKHINKFCRVAFNKHSACVSWRLKLQAPRPCVQQLVQPSDKYHINAPEYLPVWGVHWIFPHKDK